MPHFRQKTPVYMAFRQASYGRELLLSGICVRRTLGRRPLCRVFSIPGIMCLVLLMYAIGTQAQTSFPMLGGVYPLGVQRGKTADITVTAGGNGGANLYGAYKVLVEGAGVKADVVLPEKGWPEKPKPDPKDPKKEWVLPGVGEIKLHVTVAPDAPLGVREVRIATPRMGLSTIGLIVVSDDTQIMEAEPNNDVAHAQAVTLPCDVNGKIQQAEDVDSYKFTVSAGQEAVFAVQAARLQDKIHDLQEHADPVLILRDDKGVEIARNDDYYRADPLLHYKFDKAGTYIAQIRDVNYQGNGFWMYRLTMTTRPYVIAPTPCAVKPGQSADLHISGFVLNGATTAHIDVPANIPPGIWITPLKVGGQNSNPVPLLVTDTPQVVVENNVAPTASTAKTVSFQPSTNNSSSLILHPSSLHLPGGVNATLQAAGQIDRYTFTAKKGTSWGFEVASRRLDSEMDSELKLRDAKGNVLAANDDALGKDSRLDWGCPADGEYSIEIRDLTGHGGTTYFYNLSAAPLRPDFSLKCDGDRAMIAPGNRTAWFVIVDRKYGFAGDVAVEVKNLPPGVTASPLTVPPTMTQGVILLSAAPDAKIETAELQVVGTGQLPGADGKPATATRIAHPLSEIYLPGGGRGLLEVDTQGVAVTEPNDMEVSVTNPNITLKPGETLKIDVTIKRRADYAKAVTLDLRVNHLGGIFTNPLPPGVTVEDGATIPEGKDTGQITIKAAPDAKPILNWPLAVMANSSVNFVMKVWYAAPITLTIPAPPPPVKK